MLPKLTRMQGGTSVRLSDSALPCPRSTSPPNRTQARLSAAIDEPCAERVRQRLGDAGGFTDFGLTLMRLPPGNWSSQRHWHRPKSQASMCTKATDAHRRWRRMVLRAGECAAFPKAPATAIT